MKESIWVELPSPEGARDMLTELLRKGAQQLLQQAVETELAAHLEAHADRRLATGQQRVVRHGHGPERGILTGIGSLRFRRPKARDRGATEGDRIRFTSAILPRFARRTKSLDAVLPTLYLRGVSTGDFGEALSALVGPEASGLGPGVIGRPKAEWAKDHDRWRRRDLSTREYVYVWADGIYLRCRMEEDRQCVLVLLGATASGPKELLGFQTGFRESGQSWRELLEDLRGRGLRAPVNGHRKCDTFEHRKCDTFGVAVRRRKPARFTVEEVCAGGDDDHGRGAGGRLLRARRAGAGRAPGARTTQRCA